MVNDISEADRAVLRDMSEKFEYFLRKYEGFGVNIITTLFHKDGKFQTGSHINLTKLYQESPSPNLQVVK